MPDAAAHCAVASQDNSDVRSLDTKAPSEAASPPASLPRHPKCAQLATDEICKHGKDRLAMVVQQPDKRRNCTVSAVCVAKVAPEIFRLTERLDYQDPSAIIATRSRSPKVAQAGGCKSASD